MYAEQFYYSANDVKTIIAHLLGKPFQFALLTRFRTSNIVKPTGKRRKHKQRQDYYRFVELLFVWVVVYSKLKGIPNKFFANRGITKFLHQIEDELQSLDAFDWLVCDEHEISLQNHPGYPDEVDFFFCVRLEPLYMEVAQVAELLMREQAINPLPKQLLN